MSATIDIRKGFVSVLLACGNRVTVDADDEPIVMSRKWRFRTGGTGLPYVTANSYKQLYLHRVIMGAGHGQIVDHINGDRLDNRRSNLRFASRTENARNRKTQENKASRFKGVSKFSNGKWRSLIRDGSSKQIYLGQFESEVAAAYAYDIASLQIHGDFGRRNFLPLC